MENQENKRVGYERLDFNWAVFLTVLTVQYRIVNTVKLAIKNHHNICRQQISKL